MKKKYTLLCAVFIMAAFTLTGCCKHEWTEASCIAPSTCLVCGKIKGEAVDHVWSKATCEEPKTCSVCGKTEGQALGHKFSEGGYLKPGVCSVCGAEGEVKPNYFEEKGLDIVDAIPETLEAPYMIYTDANRLDFICRTNPASLSVSTASNGDGTKTINIQYNMPLTCEYQYDTDKQYYYGITNCNLYDLYTGQGISEFNASGDNNYIKSKTFNIDGQDVPVEVQIYIEWAMGEWYAPSDNLECVDMYLTKNYIATVPEDYDGLVFGVKSYVKNTTEEEAQAEANGDAEEEIFADSTGKYNTLEAGGTFIRVGK